MIFQYPTKSPSLSLSNVGRYVFSLFAAIQEVSKNTILLSRPATRLHFSVSLRSNISRMSKKKKVLAPRETAQSFLPFSVHHW